MVRSSRTQVLFISLPTTLRVHLVPHSYRMAAAALDIVSAFQHERRGKTA